MFFEGGWNFSFFFFFFLRDATELCEGDESHVESNTHYNHFLLISQVHGRGGESEWYTCRTHTQTWVIHHYYGQRNQHERWNCGLCVFCVFAYWPTGRWTWKRGGPLILIHSIFGLSPSSKALLSIPELFSVLTKTFKKRKRKTS
jgi:hypothetical protein